MNVSDRPLTLPYPGLRPFEAEDEPLFFGREAQISGMLRQLEDHRFVAVVGSSGCGKSSLVRAGLLPAIHQGFLLGTTDWRTVIMKPGQQPHQNLADALSSASRGWRSTAGVGKQLDPAGGEETRTIEALRRTDRGVIDALRELGISPDSNVLLVVDQFEELFAFRRANANREAVVSRDDAAAFVSLLVRSCAEATARLWVVLTMRSDFIGDCEAFLGLPQIVSHSQFLVPRLDRRQMEEAIARPGMVREAAYQRFTFADGLVTRIINDAGDRPDQLPLMQHALMRAWKLAVARSSQAGAPTELNHQDYKTAGGIADALSLDAELAWNALKSDSRKARIARQLFLLLCDISPDDQIVRRRPRVDEIQAVTGATVEELTEVIGVFQEDDRTFLAPPLDQGLRPDTTLDVSHEALLRHWPRFANEWLEQERSDVLELRLIAKRASDHRSGKGEWIQARELARIADWRDRVSGEWSRRYLPKERWDEAAAFIDASEREHLARQAEAARARKRALNRARWSALAAATIAIVLVAGIAIRWFWYERDYSAYFNDFVKKHGAPQGVDPVTEQQARDRPWSIRIVRKGTRGLAQRMEAVDNNLQLTERHEIGTYISVAADNEKSSAKDQKAVRWDYLYFDNRVAYEVAFDKSGKQLWTFVYFPGGQDGAKEVRVGHFVGPDGYPRQDVFVEIEYSPKGYEQLITYRNREGKPQASANGFFGLRRTYDEGGRPLETSWVGKDDAELQRRKDDPR